MQIDHMLIERRWHSIELDVHSFKGANCDMDYYVVVAKVRERLAVSKQAAKKFDRDGVNLKKLNEVEIRKQYLIDHIFCICQILEKKWEYNEAVHHLFITLQESLGFNYEGGLV